jgi:hypothetical protein
MYLDYSSAHFTLPESQRPPPSFSPLLLFASLPPLFSAASRVHGPGRENIKYYFPSFSLLLLTNVISPTFSLELKLE